MYTNEIGILIIIKKDIQVDQKSDNFPILDLKKRFLKDSKTFENRNKEKMKSRSKTLSEAFIYIFIS